MRIIEDFKAFSSGGGLSKKATTLLLNPCFHSVCLYRLSNFFHRIHLDIAGKIIWYINRLLFHVDIDFRADLAGGFMLVHGLGTVIGFDVVSKGPLKIYQNVTLGSAGNGKKRLDPDGVAREMPLFEGSCIVYTGSLVVGGIRIKDNAVIKAGSIVSSDLL